MKENKILKRILLALVGLIIVLPILILLIWGFSETWRFPDLLPTKLSLRGLYAAKNILRVVISSIFISVSVGILSTIIGTMASRSLVIEKLKYKKVFLFLNLLPLMVPATAFAMGIHITFIRIGLNDTVLGVIIVHLICSLPYSFNIMYDVTKSIGKKFEDQAAVLGASQWQSFWQISFYVLVPGFATSFFISFVVSFSQYFITLIIGGGNVITLSTIMIPFIQSGDRTISGMYSILFLLTTMIVFSISDKILGGKNARIKGDSCIIR